jgi:hypothetical protein
VLVAYRLLQLAAPHPTNSVAKWLSSFPVVHLGLPQSAPYFLLERTAAAADLWARWGKRIAFSPAWLGTSSAGCNLRDVVAPHRRQGILPPEAHDQGEHSGSGELFGGAIGREIAADAGTGGRLVWGAGAALAYGLARRSGGRRVLSSAGVAGGLFSFIVAKYSAKSFVHHATIFKMNVESYRRRAALERKRCRGRPPTYPTISANA